MQKALAAAKLTKQSRSLADSDAKMLLAEISKGEGKWSFANSPSALQPLVDASDKLEMAVRNNKAFG
eukprot:221902-Pyramimonas_sp.AAC.1